MKRTTKSKRLITNAMLAKKLWKEFSKYIRSARQCYTCETYYPPAKLNAGHYRHGVLDFDEVNIHAQCVGCNKWKHGLLDIYSLNIIRDYGLKAFKNLHTRAEKAKKDGEYYSDELLTKKLEYYKKLNEDMEQLQNMVVIDEVEVTL